MKKKTYAMPPEKGICTCKGDARRDGRDFSITISTSNHRRNAILKVFDGLAENYCEACQFRFKAGFFEENQLLEDIAHKQYELKGVPGGR
jgi:hypothetical protein